MAKNGSTDGPTLKLRSQAWFDNPDDPGMTSLYIERYLNWGITREELQSGKPIIGYCSDRIRSVALQPSPH